MGKVNHISKAWPTFIGEFFYPEHKKIKNNYKIPNLQKNNDNPIELIKDNILFEEKTE